MSSHSSARASDGFTLLEVLVAMILISVGFLALYGLSVHALRGVALAEKRDAYIAEASRMIEATNFALENHQITSFPVSDSIIIPGAVLRREVVCAIVSDGGSTVARRLQTRITVVTESHISLSTQLDSHLYDPNQTSC